jgi:hypothetical protein
MQKPADVAPQTLAGVSCGLRNAVQIDESVNLPRLAAMRYRNSGGGERESYPELGGLLTDTADSNAPMRGINDALGYVPTHTTYEYQLDL